MTFLGTSHLYPLVLYQSTHGEVDSWLSLNCGRDEGIRREDRGKVVMEVGPRLVSLQGTRCCHVEVTYLLRGGLDAYEGNVQGGLSSCESSWVGGLM